MKRCRTFITGKILAADSSREVLKRISRILRIDKQPRPPSAWKRSFSCIGVETIPIHEQKPRSPLNYSINVFHVSSVSKFEIPTLIHN